jgi:hypothetical protein
VASLVGKRTIPTERPPLSAKYRRLLRLELVAWSAQRIPPTVNLGFLDWSRDLLFQLTSRGCIDPVSDSILRKISVSAGNRTRGI